MSCINEIKLNAFLKNCLFCVFIFPWIIQYRGRKFYWFQEIRHIGIGLPSKVFNLSIFTGKCQSAKKFLTKITFIFLHDKQ